MSDEWVDVEIGPALSSEDDEWVDVPASPTSVTDDGYLSEFFSTLFSKEGSLTDLYEGSIGGLKNTAKAFGQSSNKALAGIYDPNSDTPGIIKMAGQLGTPFEMVRNFYKGKDVEKGLLDTSKLITGAIPGADLAVDKINQALAPESFPATTAKEDARRFRREVVGPVALTGALRTFGKGANATSKAFEDAAQATKERALGIQYGDKSGGLGKQAVYLDAEGNVVPKGMATEITSSVQQKVKALEDFGFLKKASNKPSEALSQLQKQHLETELVIDNLIDKADAAVGNQSFLPEWSKTKAYFQNLRDSKQKALAPELEKITRDYALDPETGMRKIIKLKRQFSDDADFARANAPEKAELYQAAYLDLQELGERVFDAAVPQSKGAFKAANELASAEIGVTKTLPKAVARKNPGIFETFITLVPVRLRVCTFPRAETSTTGV
jgi:hypothetical protein